LLSSRNSEREKKESTTLRTTKGLNPRRRNKCGDIFSFIKSAGDTGSNKEREAAQEASRKRFT